MREVSFSAYFARSFTSKILATKFTSLTSDCNSQKIHVSYFPHSVNTLFTCKITTTLFFFTVANCEKTISLVLFLAHSLYNSWIALTYCWMERIPCGYVECLDCHNSVNIDAKDLIFESNIVADIQIRINDIGLWSINRRIGYMENYRMRIRGSFLWVWDVCSTATPSVSL